MDWSSFACGMAAMAPAQVLLVLGFRHRGRRLATAERRLHSSAATMRVQAREMRRLRERLKAAASPPARPPLSPATVSRPEAKPRDLYTAPGGGVDPAATVVIPEQRDATVVLPATADPSSTVELPPAPPVLRLAPGMAEYPRRPRLAGGRGPS